MERVILHSDMNNFYASVECMLHPELKGKPVAVCGSTSERHGIVLAKNYEAKAYGVQTGEVTWQAQEKCKDLVIVPPHYDMYIKYSKLARQIYARYTDLIEPFGMDECWLDVTGSQNLFGDGFTMANEIKETIKSELGLTVSVGVSFNKIFAKLGSDMKKPDAVTCIYSNDFKEKIWHLPASDMLGVGFASKRKLDAFGIYTIGQLANADPNVLQASMKSHGLTLWRFANGYDNSPVMEMNYKSPIKSVGHGITTRRDLQNESDVWPVILELSFDIGHKLRENGLSANGVSICVRDTELLSKEWQTQMPLSTQSDTYIATMAFRLFQRCYSWEKDIRSITIRAIDLQEADTPIQIDFFSDRTKVDKLERIDRLIDQIRTKYGEKSILRASLLNLDSLAPEKSKGIKMPSGLLTCR